METARNSLPFLAGVLILGSTPEIIRWFKDNPGDPVMLVSVAILCIVAMVGFWLSRDILMTMFKTIVTRR